MPDRPNVVVIIVDTLRADFVYGDRARTPNMDALARDGVRFIRHHPEAMPTVPARNSIMSGRRDFPFRGWHPGYHGLLAEPGWEPIDSVRATFTSNLKRAGYWTAYATDNPFLGFARGYGRFRASFDRFARRGGAAGGSGKGVSDRTLNHWLHPAMSDPVTRARVRKYLANGGYWNDERKSFAARVFRDGSQLLEIGKRARPFCVVVDTFQPHEPWTPPDKYLKMYGDPGYRGPEPSKPYYSHVGNYLNGPDRGRLLARMRDLYAAEVTMTDRWLGVFLDRLHDLRLDRETAILMVSDHGFLLGDRGYTGKVPSELHPGLARTPLTIVHPDHRRHGRVSRYLAQTHDVAPTVLRLAGVRVPERMTGADLSKVFDGKRPRRRPAAHGGYANNFYIRTHSWALLGTNGRGGGKLYDLRRDPGETRDVSGSHPGKVSELRTALRRRAGRLPHYDF